MNTSNRAIRTARKAKAMRLQRWQKVPYNFSKTHCLYGFDARITPTKSERRHSPAHVADMAGA